MSLSNEERETIILSNDADNFWEVYTCQQKIMTKMRKLGVEPYEIQTDLEGNIISCSYKLDLRQISFRKIIELSDEQKEKRSEHMKNIRRKNETQNQNNDVLVN